MISFCIHITTSDVFSTGSYTCISIWSDCLINCTSMFKIRNQYRHQSWVWMFLRVNCVVSSVSLRNQFTIYSGWHLKQNIRFQRQSLWQSHDLFRLNTLVFLCLCCTHHTLSIKIGISSLTFKCFYIKWQWSCHRVIGVRSVILQYICTLLERLKQINKVQLAPR